MCPNPTNEMSRSGYFRIKIVGVDKHVGHSALAPPALVLSPFLIPKNNDWMHNELKYEKNSNFKYVHDYLKDPPLENFLKKR